MNTTQHSPAVLQRHWHPFNAKTQQCKRSSPSPIRPKRVIRPHHGIIQSRHLRLNGCLFISGPSRQHFAKQQLQSRSKYQKDPQDQAVKRKQHSPRKTSANFDTHEASSSIMASARSRRDRWTAVEAFSRTISCSAFLNRKQTDS